VASAPLNWHLFNTVDVAKFRTGTIEHLSTAPLVGGPVSSMCTEQVDVPGIPKPPMDIDPNDVVSWGVVSGTRVGYIYVWAWYGNAEPAFAQAIRELTQDQQTDGLIIDFRFNLGGNMFLSNEGLNMLFKRPTATVNFDMRADPADHFAMEHNPAPPIFYAIDGGPISGRDPAYYERPIAVLTGPGAVSSGDQVALRMTFHPNVRTFGKSTATAFNSPIYLDVHPDWSMAVAAADAYRLDEPGNYLTHDQFVVDEPVWLTPSDVAEGRDTVVEAALRWIAEQ
jgi:C-terminal processing protease CtpA/Prc